MRSSLLWILLAISGGAVPGFAQPIEQMPGWPIALPGYYSGFRGMTFADLNSDGHPEIILYRYQPGEVWAWDYEGNAMPGFPIALEVGTPTYPPSVGDLDGDGDPEIVVFSNGYSATWEATGALYAFDHLGAPLAGFPVTVTGSHWSPGPPVLADLDQDGQLEILAIRYQYAVYSPEYIPAAGYLHVFENDGSEWGGNWPVQLDGIPCATPAAGDAGGDGTIEICAVSYTSIYLLNTDGTVRSGFPFTLPAGSTFDRQSPVLADIDDDSDCEIVFACSSYDSVTYQYGSVCYVLDGDGTVFPGWPQIWWGAGTNCPPTVTDLEGDGNIEILGGTSGLYGADSPCFWVWDINGNIRPGFPYMNSAANGANGSDGPLTVADINGDGILEIFADAKAFDYNTQDGLLFGVDANGTDLPGFPLQTVGSTWSNGATIGDVDGDGDYELGVVSGTMGTTPELRANLYTLSGLTAHPTSRDWLTYHGSCCRDGVYPAVAAGCPGDIDGDGKTDLADLGILLASYNQCPGDPYYDGRANLDDDDGTACVDLADLGVLLSGYGCGT